ncbi:MAG: bifunctional phosphoribosyl-AMP cyclohydrolase/phosphoribosyl-ATP diphosphatase HisIE [Deltaproteobacteria bacterium]|nr:bifunctional phosphoribosyl-AMP cyclohydrolase/phosphoribosyl-ATP diphosphatase HisIE [Deltaproteobacteria bacterium]
MAETVNLSEIKFGADGLIPAIAQDINTSEVLMMAYMDMEALLKTIETRRAHYWSRSRRELWLKGSTSGNFQEVRSVFYDCDGDTLLLLVEPKGPACHTGERSCFYRALAGQPEKGSGAGVIKALYRTAIERKTASPDKSYTAYLYSKGLSKILEKLEEESGELIEAAREKGDKEVVHEMADLIFHGVVLLALRGIDIEELFGELKRRSGASGIEEKRRRGNKDGTKKG